MNLNKKSKIRKSDEVFIMNSLKKNYPSKYKNAEFSERPDIWVPDKSIGVEVTSGVFEDIYLSFRAFGKDIITSKKIMREKPVSYKEIEWVFHYSDHDLEEITGSKFIYRDKNKEIKIINNIEDLKDNINKYKIREVESYEIDNLDEEYKSKVGPGVAVWEGEWNILLIERIEEKIDKFKTYKKFNENNLAIFTFMFSEDFNDAEEVIKEHYYNKYMPFDNIYLCDNDGTVKVITF